MAPTRASLRFKPRSPWRRRWASTLSKSHPIRPRRWQKFSMSANTRPRRRKGRRGPQKQKNVGGKEIKLRPMIDDHDYLVKMRSMHRFFEEGDKVKVTL